MSLEFEDNETLKIWIENEDNEEKGSQILSGSELDTNNQVLLED